MYPGGVGTLVEVNSASTSLTLSQKCDVHRISIPVVLGIPVFLGPSVELEVAHCSKFLLIRNRAEPVNAQSLRVWSMDKTTCPSRSVHSPCSFAVDHLQCRLFNPRDTVLDPGRSTGLIILTRFDVHSPWRGCYR